MDLKYYPLTRHWLENTHKNLFGEQAGILQSNLLLSMGHDKTIPILSLSGQMPYYHKALIGPNVDIQYHLGGYGYSYEEAMVRYGGEGIERYALMVGQFLYREKIKFASYKQIKEEGRVIPFEYVDIYSEEDYDKLRKAKFVTVKKPTQNDTIGWIKCLSLFNKNEEIYLPAQMIFAGYLINQKVGEIRFIPGFSKGTASHVSPEAALLNAILEFIEIDATLLSWYTKKTVPKIIVDEAILFELFPDILSLNSSFEVLNLDLGSLSGLNAHVFGTLLLNKKNEKPLLLYGAQAHLDPIKGLYRSLMEAMAIIFLPIYGTIYAPNEYLVYPQENVFSDLDTNVAYYAFPHDAEKKKELIYSLVEGRKTLSSLKNYAQGSVKEQVKKLLVGLRKVSQDAVYLDVTPPEAKERGWEVIRVFIPELLNMCLPGVPYSNHPRIKENGGIKNQYPHPLP